MSRYRARLEVVELDARIVPSVTPVPLPVHGTPVVVHSAITQTQTVARSLKGVGSGTLLAGPSFFGGTFYGLRGSGTFGSLGQATISGSLRLPTTVGAITGTLRLASASGSVTLQLSGTGGQFVYTVLSATGTGVGVPHSGTLTLGLAVASRQFSLSI